MRSTSVCGDDLAAHATARQIRQYKYQLLKHGLQANESKEFMAKNGVFCERLLTPDMAKEEYDDLRSETARKKDFKPSKRTPYFRGTIRSQAVPKLSELGATKYLGGFSRGRAKALRSIPEGMTKSTRWLAAKTKARLASKRPAGPLLMGGNGLSNLPTPSQLFRTVKCGKIPINPKASKASKELRDTLNVSRTPYSGDQHTFEKVRTLHFQLEYYKGKNLGDEITDKQLRARSSPFNSKRKTSKKEWLEIIAQNKKLTRANKRMLGHKLRSGCQPTNRRFRKTLTAMLGVDTPEYVESYDDSLNLTERQSKLTSPKVEKEAE